MVLNVLTNVLNVIFGYLLIYGYMGFPRLEVLGAGIGTIGARAITSVLYIVAMYNKGCVLPLSFRQNHRLDMEVISRIMRIGVPAAVEQFVLRGGQTVFAKTVASLGTVPYAAHQLTVNAESFAFNPPTGFQVSATTLVGQYLGADRPDLAERSGYVNSRMAMIMMLFMGLGCYVFARQIMGIYTDDISVIDMAVPNMRLFAVALPGMATSFVMIGALRGAGDTKWPLYVSIGRCLGRQGLPCIHTGHQARPRPQRHVDSDDRRRLDQSSAVTPAFPVRRVEKDTGLEQKPCRQRFWPCVKAGCFRRNKVPTGEAVLCLS